MTASNRPSNAATRIMDAAARDKFAVPAVCLYNLEAIIACVQAAEAKQSPIFIQLFPWAIEYAGGLLVHAAAEAARNASVPVAVHLDHCQDPEMVKRAADMGGFHGIMIDMSHFEKEENLRRTKELVAYCHARNIATEAEPGRINGGEEGVADTVDLDEVLTTPEEAQRFVDTNVDWLAPAFGNVHGNYGPKGPSLDYERLENVHKYTQDKVHLVLHGAGTQWFDEKRFTDCIERGIAKCNINDAINGPFLEKIHSNHGKPITTLIEEGTATMREAIEKHMDWMRSTGKASSIVRA